MRLRAQAFEKKGLVVRFRAQGHSRAWLRCDSQGGEVSHLVSVGNQREGSGSVEVTGPPVGCWDFEPWVVAEAPGVGKCKD